MVTMIADCVKLYIWLFLLHEISIGVIKVFWALNSNREVQELAHKKASDPQDVCEHALLILCTHILQVLASESACAGAVSRKSRGSFRSSFSCSLETMDKC